MRCVLRCCCLGMLAVAWLAGPAGAADAPGTDMPEVSLMLIREPSVQADLKLRSHQKELIDKHAAEVDAPFFLIRDKVTREHARSLEDALRKFERRLQSVLTRDQYRRLDNIRVQWLGLEYFFQQRPARRFKMTPEQQEKIRGVIKETWTKLQDIGHTNPAEAPNDVVREEVTKIRDDCAGRIRQILDERQRKLWDTMRGEPFDMSKLRALRPRAPEIQGIEKWINSEPMTLESLRGKVVVVHFWTFGCGNCVRNYPIYRKWQEQFGKRDFVMIGLHTPEFDEEKDPAVVAAKAKENKLDFAVAVDNNAETWNAWGNRWWPAVYLFDKDGYLRNWWYGELNYKDAGGEKLMTERIELLLAQPVSK